MATLALLSLYIEVLVSTHVGLNGNVLGNEQDLSLSSLVS